MSADNWGLCPRCSKEAVDRFVKEVDHAKKQYGKIPEEEYFALMKKSQNQPELGETLREDYEIHTNGDGLFYVNYSCSCGECGFEHHFKHEEKLAFMKRSTNVQIENDSQV